MGRPRLRKWSIRIGRILFFVYLGLCILAFFMQKYMIYPGTSTQGNHEARVLVGPNQEKLALHTADGTPIIALFGKSLISGDPTQAPTVIYFYGNASCLGYSSETFDYVQRIGANIIAADFPGYGMSGGSASEKNCYATADALYDYLMSRSDIDHDKIVPGGWSLGSGVATDLASRRKVDGLILISAYTSIPDVAGGMVPWLPTSLLVTQRFDNLKKIPGITCPILFFHGNIDTLVPPDMSLRLQNAAKSRTTRVIFEGAGHNDVWDIGGQKLWQDIADFLKSLP